MKSRRLTEDADIRLISGIMGSYDALIVRLSIIIVFTLFLIGATLFVVGLFYLVDAWFVIIGNYRFFPSNWKVDMFSRIIQSIGSIVLGYAILELSRSILREEITEGSTIDVHLRAREFLTRFLAVIIVAISIELFVDIARYSTQPEIISEVMWQIASVGVSLAFMLVGLGIFLKLSKKQ